MKTEKEQRLFFNISHSLEHRDDMILKGCIAF